MKKWFSTEFGRLTLASILSLLAFPLLYKAGFGQNQGLLLAGLVLFAIAAVIPMADIFRKKE